MFGSKFQGSQEGTLNVVGEGGFINNGGKPVYFFGHLYCGGGGLYAPLSKKL